MLCTAVSRCRVACMEKNYVMLRLCVVRFSGPFKVCNKHNHTHYHHHTVPTTILCTSTSTLPPTPHHSLANLARRSTAMSDAEDEIPLQAPGDTIRMGGVHLDKDALAAGIEKGNISMTTSMGGADTIRLTEVLVVVLVVGGCGSACLCGSILFVVV